MKYAILQGEKLTYAPKLLRLDDGRTVSNPNGDTLRQAGYKPVTETPMPSEDGFFFTPRWTETDTEIVQEWEKHQIPEPEPAADFSLFFASVRSAI